MWVNAIVALVSSAVGALAGAWAAFALERRNRLSLEHESDYAALLQAFFCCNNQLQFLKHLWRDSLEQHQNNPNRHFDAQALVTSKTNIILDVASLMFVLNSNSPELLEQLVKCRDEYLAMLNIYRARRELMVKMKKKSTGADEAELLRMSNSLYERMVPAIKETRRILGTLNEYLRMNFSEKPNIPNIFIEEN